jgi:iron complex outermembrane receptor protein
MRVAVNKSSFGGVVKNLTTGDRLNGSRSTNFVGKLEWRPNDQWNVTFSPRASESTVNCCVQPFSSMTPGGLYQNGAAAGIDAAGRDQSGPGQRQRA